MLFQRSIERKVTNATALAIEGFHPEFDEPDSSVLLTNMITQSNAMQYKSTGLYVLKSVLKCVMIAQHTDDILVVWALLSVVVTMNSAGTVVVLSRWFPSSLVQQAMSWKLILNGKYGNKCHLF